MTSLLLANTPISRVSLPSDFLVLFLGVVMIEPIALWLFLKKWRGFNVTFPRLLLYSLVANAVSTALGPILEITLLLPITFVLFPMGFGGNPFVITAKLSSFYASTLPFQVIYLLLSFGISCLVEWLVVYRLIKFYDGNQWQKLGRPMTTNATLLANLASYSFLTLYIAGISFLPLQLSPEYQLSSANGGTYVVRQINNSQMNFYGSKERFAPTFAELLQKSSTGILYRLRIVSSNQAKSKLYAYTLVVDANQAIVTAQALFPSLKSSTGIVFMTSQQGLNDHVCRTDAASQQPPALLRQSDKVQCPTGSSPARSPLSSLDTFLETEQP